MQYYLKVYKYRFDGSQSTEAAGAPIAAVYTPGLPASLMGQCTCEDQQYAGDPVNTATGVVTEQATDASVPGPGMPFSLARSYRSDATNTTGLLGQGWRLPFEASVSVNATSGAVTLIDGDGAQVMFTKNPDGSYTGPVPVRYTLAAVAGGGFTVTALDNSVRTFDASGRLTSMVDVSGKGLILGYTTGVLSSVTDAAGRAAALTVYPAGDPAAGLLEQVTLADGRSVSYSYTNRQLTGVKDVTGGLTQYSYDAGGRLAKVTDPKQQVIEQNTYDQTTGRITQQIDASNQTWKFAWTPTPNAPAGSGESDVTDPANGIWTDVYSAGVLMGHYNPYFNGSARTVDQNLDISGLRDGNGTTVNYTYFPDGDVETETDPVSGAIESWTYDAPGLVHSHTAPFRGNTTIDDHDPATHLLTNEIDPLGSKTSYTYNAAGQVLTKTLPLGNVAGATAVTQALYTTTNTYDSSGNLLSSTDGLGNKTSYTYYPTGQVETTTDPRGNVAGANPAKFTTSYTYDAAGRVLTTTDPDGNVTTNHYDADGNRDWSEDGLNQRTLYTYDASNRLTDTVDPSGAKTHTDYYDNGQVKDTIDGNDHETSYTYDSANRLASTVAARGNLPTTDPNYSPPANYTTTYSYDGNGNQILVTDPLGNATRTEYDADNRPWRVTDPVGTVSSSAGAAVPGHQKVTKYDANGNTIEVDTPTGDGTTNAVTTTHYDLDNRVDYMVEPRGNLTSTPDMTYATHFSYDADGNKISQTLPMGEQTQWVYDADNRQVQTIDPRGTANNNALAAQYTTTNVYDPAGHLIQTTDGTGAVTQYGFDGAGNKTSKVDPRGQLSGNTPADYTTVYGYDADNRQVSVLAPKTASVPNPVAAVTTYDAAGNVVAVADAAGNTTTFGYDQAHQKTSMTTPRGFKGLAQAGDPNYTTTYGFDPDGNQITVTDPETAQVPSPKPTTTAFDADNHARTVTDPLGNQTTTDYNSLGQLDWTKDALQGQTKYGYDTAGNQTSVTTPRGNTTATPDPKYTTASVFDLAGHKVSQTTPQGDKTTWAFDKDGRVSSTIDPRGYAAGVSDPTVYQTTYSYDAAGNQSAITDPLKNTTATTYDADNRVIAATDALKKSTTTYAYWPNGAVETVTDPLQHATSYTYDQVGNLTTRVDANTHTTTYGFDSARKLRQVTDPSGHGTTYVYDADGNLATTTDARGTTSTVTTDARELATGITYSDTTPAVTFTYDSDHQQVGITDATGTRTETYDQDGHLRTASIPGAANPFAYNYDADGNITSRQYPDGETAAYTYNPDEQMATQAADGTTSTYSYDPAGHYTGYVAPNSAGAPIAAETRTYDAAGNLASIGTANAGGTVSSWAVTRDADNRPTGITATRTGQATTSKGYTYDLDGRLQSESCTAATASLDCPAGSQNTAWTYDNVGNRLTQTTGGTVTNYNYNNLDELTTSTTGGTTTTYSYDTDGNLTGDGTSAYTYDANNHLTGVTTGSTTAAFTLDAQGNRTAITTGSNTQNLIWDPNSPLPQLAYQTGPAGDLGDYHYDPTGTPQSIKTATGNLFLAHDDQGSVTDLIDQNGTLQAQYAYTAFGIESPSSTSNQADLASNPFGYTGQLNDSAISGDQDLRARDYDPATGRFGGRDPIDIRVNDPYVAQYIYAADASTYIDDPSGLSPTPENDTGISAQDIAEELFGTLQDLAESANDCDGMDDANFWKVYCTGHATTVMTMAWQINERNMSNWIDSSSDSPSNVDDPLNVLLSGNRVTTQACDNTIPNAAKDDPKSGLEKDRGNGIADIINWEPEKVQIWEVKHSNSKIPGVIGTANDELRVAPAQIARYVQKLQLKLRNDGDPRMVEAGDNLRPETAPDLFNPAMMVDMWSSPIAQGVIAYHERFKTDDEKRAGEPDRQQQPQTVPAGCTSPIAMGGGKGLGAVGPYADSALAAACPPGYIWAGGGIVNPVLPGQQVPAPEPVEPPIFVGGPVFGMP
ncbi:DUF6531 domain-containing protein [Catenulispora pinisilvae]|uniref:DUF6531 domain-containing protein n=1 Tax=Catenulispora pinisilvae TaxID=2705253 RepID=UPI001891F3D3|nr:DUF6531 domain-containing protein [Catenulispora pinisilvae]